jgi:glycosyltransferase involved in cell wall biosynthesis
LNITLVANAYPPHFIGGAEIAAHRQAVELVSRGHELSCFCSYTDPAREAYAYSNEVVDGVVVRRVNVPGTKFQAEENFSNPVVESLFADFLRENRPDVVHFHNMPGLSLGLLDVATEQQIPSAITFHDHWGFCLRNTLVRANETRVCPNWDECYVCLGSALMDGVRMPTFLRTNFIRLKLHKASLFHFPSHYLQGAYGKAFFDLGRAKQHTYGVAKDWFESSVSHPAGERIRAVFVGYFGRHKGPHVLMDALQLLQGRKLLDRFEIDFYGHGEMQGELEERIEVQGWRDRVRIRGKADNAAMKRIYAEADLMLNCSMWPENEPVTILEALASGTPVIATTLGGNLELVLPGVNGWLYPPASAEALADILGDLANRGEELRQMRGAARKSVSARTIASYGDFALAAYRDLRVVGPELLPSIVAVACEDFSGVDFGALWNLQRSEYWNCAELTPARGLRGPAEMQAIVAVISLDGTLPATLVENLPQDTPVIVVGELGSKPAGFARFTDVVRVADLDQLRELGRFMQKISDGAHRAQSA